MVFPHLLDNFNGRRKPVFGPTTLFSDAFLGIDEDSLDAHTPEIDVIGGGWTERVGDWKINNNEAALDATIAAGVATADVGNADVTISLKTKSSPSGISTTLTLQPDVDTGLRSASPTFNYGLVISLALSTSEKALLKFDVSSIPSNNTITSAILYVYHSLVGATGNVTATIWSVAAGNAAWIEGTRFGQQALAGEPCWNALAADGAGGVTTAWAGSAGLGTADVDYETPALGTYTHARNDPLGTEFSAALTISRIQDWVTNNTNYGLLITHNFNQGDIYSSEFATAANRPKLVVEYTESDDPREDVGAIARWLDSNNYWLIGQNSRDDEFRIWEKNVGSYTKRASAAVALDANTYYDIEVTTSEQNITATLDGGNSISYGSAALNENETIHGMQLQKTGTSDRNDDFVVTT